MPPKDVNGTTWQRLQKRAAQEGRSLDELLNRWLESSTTDFQFDNHVMDAAPASILITDARQPDHPIVFANAVFEKTTGYNRYDVIGTNCRFLQGDDRDQPDLERIRQALNEGTACTVVLRNYRKDGTMFWNELRIAPLRDVHGKVTHFIGIQHDITERKRMEDTLRRSESRLQSLLESQSAFVMRTDMNGEYTYVNPAFVSWYGWKREKLLSESVLETIDVLDHEKTERAVEACVSQPGQPVQVLLRKRMPDRGLRHTLWEFMGIQDSSGAVTEIQCVGFDITKQVELEEALQQSETRYRSAVEASLDAFYLLESVRDDTTGDIIDFRIIELNEHAIQQMGLSRSILVNGLICELFPINRTGGYFEQYKRVVETGQPFEQDYMIPAGHTAPGWYHHQVVKVGDGVAIVNRDITERKQAEAIALENERLKTQFHKEQDQNELMQRMISMLSHDLRTPLAVIASSRDLLDRYYDRLSEEKRREKLEAIGRQIQFALEMLQDTVNMARGNLSKRDFRPAPTNLAVLCEVSVQEIQVARRDNHIVHFTNPGDVGTAYIDEVLVSRILLNLLSNALKYSPDGGEIHLELDQRDEWIVLRVIDEGTGISEADLPHLFEPFYRADDVNHIEGTGLGLSIVKDCVDRHQGRIHVQSKLGQGSTFTVELSMKVDSSDQ